ncbi:MAG: bifunctional diaminohydroxyphosphoribosylaminopyrimidine deaminase/5-amino-6-(5-phosphoribosylamino)uracil reductase RibD [Comamonadaceae bacterium]|nr:bifunctional diaminohydroxyphosphoribosylaminopyrimidine deaminase/5-amino-6-(5-phosphoribosylamino)uracil reductase RibD [Comamonadaceae bacterium]
MDTDLIHLQAALDASRHSLTLSNPNPRVGCVLVAADGRVIGTGHTQQAGGPHAEVMALRDAVSRSEPTLGATAYVTLEPCSHFGRTPPCCDALLQARVARVVVACGDPNPLVAGRGLSRLREAGVPVDLMPPDSPLALAMRELNIGFFHRMERGRPWVRMKLAASLDGITALGNGQSQWITGPEARADGHAWRARACAVLTGIGTVAEDNPRLDVRELPVSRQPDLVVIDSHLRTPPDARLFEPAHGGMGRRIHIFHAVPDAAAASALAARGARLQQLPGAGGKVDLKAMIEALGQLEINELHVEAGYKLNGSLLRAGLVDELLVYLAPTLLGEGAGLAHLGALERLSDGVQLRWTDMEPVGKDIRLRATVIRRS